MSDEPGSSVAWNCLVPVTSGIRPIQLLVELRSDLSNSIGVHFIKLSCSDDVTFLYTCSLNSENYANLAEKQSLNLQFIEFPDFFKNLLQNAVGDQNKYVMSLMTVSSSEDEGSEIELIVTRQSHDSSLVQVKKLSLLFQSATDEQIKQYLISKSKMDKKIHEKLILENKRLEKLLAEEKVKNKELEDAKIWQANQLEIMQKLVASSQNLQLQYECLLSPSSSTNRLSIGQQHIFKPNEPQIEQLITSTSRNLQSPSLGDRSSKSPVMNTPPTYCFRNEASIKVEPAEESMQALPVTTFTNGMPEAFSNAGDLLKFEGETSARASGAIIAGARATGAGVAGPSSEQVANHSNVFRDSETEEVLPIGVGVGYRCVFCGNDDVIGDLDTTIDHVTQHLIRIEEAESGGTLFKCYLCPDMCVKDMQAMQKHLIQCHALKTYVCLFCGKEGKLHFIKCHNRIHTGERPYRCRECGRNFSDASTLRRHRRVHTGEKPFECPICYRRIARKDNVKVHMKSHDVYNGYMNMIPQSEVGYFPIPALDDKKMN